MPEPELKLISFDEAATIPADTWILLADAARPILDRARGWAPSYILDVAPGSVRAYRLDVGRKVEPLEAVMDLDDDTAELRQIEAREAAIARLWARDRWGI